MDPAQVVTLRVALRDRTGSVVRRVRLCWTEAPSAGDLIGAVGTLVLSARREGYEVEIVAASPDVFVVLEAAGFDVAGAVRP